MSSERAKRRANRSLHKNGPNNSIPPKIKTKKKKPRRKGKGKILPKTTTLAVNDDPILDEQRKKIAKKKKKKKKKPKNANTNTNSKEPASDSSEIDKSVSDDSQHSMEDSESNTDPISELFALFNGKTKKKFRFDDTEIISITEMGFASHHICDMFSTIIGMESFEKRAQNCGITISAGKLYEFHMYCKSEAKNDSEGKSEAKNECSDFKFVDPGTAKFEVTFESSTPIYAPFIGLSHKDNKYICPPLPSKVPYSKRYFFIIEFVLMIKKAEQLARYYSEHKIKKKVKITDVCSVSSPTYFWRKEQYLLMLFNVNKWENCLKDENDWAKKSQQRVKDALIEYDLMSDVLKREYKFEFKENVLNIFGKLCGDPWIRVKNLRAKELKKKEKKEKNEESVDDLSESD